MTVLHILIMPALTLILSILIQDRFTHNDFLNYFKMYFFGIITGIVFIILSAFAEKPFEDSVYIFTVLIRSICKGVILSTIMSIGLYIIMEFFSEINMYKSWSISSIFSFSYITGIYTIINIREAMLKESPNYPTSYLAFIPMVILLSLTVGFAVYIISDSYSLLIKILWAILFLFLSILIMAAYNFLNFYNYIYKFLFLLLFISLATLFELREFKYFR